MNLDTLLPSQAKKTLVEFFLQKLVSSPRDIYQKPRYRAGDAHKDAESMGVYAQRCWYECFVEAESTFHKNPYLLSNS